MSYCSLEEAWGPNTICSRVKNTKGKKNNLSYTITNEKHCTENNFMYNDLEDNYSLLPQNNNINNSLLDINTNNTILNPTNSNKELDVNPNDATFFGYQNISPSSMNENDVEDNNIEKNDINENIMNENNIEENNIEENKYNDNDDKDNEKYINKDNIEGFSNNNNNNIENFTATLDNIMTRLEAIEAKLSNGNNRQGNVHDIILYVIIGVFILFALDSIFKIGRLTV
jgi:hypothetical protein